LLQLAVAGERKGLSEYDATGQRLGRRGLGATWFTTSVLALTLPAVPLYVIGLAILAYNAVLRVVLARRLVAVPRVVRAFENLAKLQIGLDWR